MKQRMFLFGVFLLLFLFEGCAPPEKKVSRKSYDRPLDAGEQALIKIEDPYLIPDFTLGCLDLEGLEGAIEKSLHYLQKPSSKQFYPINGITHSRVVRSLEAFKKLLASGLSGAGLDAAIREKFDVYMSVGCDKKGTVLYTGYYTPIFDGSFQRTDKYQHPLYKKPNDLVKSSLGETRGRRTADGQILPYPSRWLIESTNMLAGKELLWLSSAFEAYVAQVQGSAKVRLQDGKLVTVGYAANNGREYRSVSQELVRDGKIAGDELSLNSMMEYFQMHPEEVEEYTNRNPRFIFFKKQDGAPRGSLNEPVTALRTIATDKSIFPRAALTFITAALPRYKDGGISNEVYSSFALDQDTGGAIRAPGRCDVYMGTGAPAGQLAGRTRQEGKLYYLFVKEGI